MKRLLITRPFGTTNGVTGGALKYPILTLSSKEQYENLKIETDSPVLIGWFNIHSSLAGKLFEADFLDLANQFTHYQFFKCDIDQVPHAAYDLEVVDAPQISVLPVGMKPDGSLYDKTDLVTIKAELGRYDEIVQKARIAIAAIKVKENIRTVKPLWVFDPATGTTLPKHQLY